MVAVGIWRTIGVGTWGREQWGSESGGCEKHVPPRMGRREGSQAVVGGGCFSRKNLEDKNGTGDSGP